MSLYPLGFPSRSTASRTSARPAAARAKRGAALLVAAALLLAALAGCGDEKSQPQSAPANSTQLPAGDQVRVRHILIQYAGAEGATPQVKRSKAAADSLMKSLLGRFEKGEKFEDLARQYSDDASAAEGGEIAPLQPGDVPAEFASAAAALKPGGVSPIFETPLGYHLVLRLGTAEQRIACEHILIRFHGASGAPDSLLRGRAEALALAEKVLTEVQNPTSSFPVAASIYSDDEQSAPKGGYLGEILPGQMVKSFEDAAFALAEGQISGIVESPYGFHIIRRVKIETIGVRQILIAHAASDGPERVMARGRDEALQRAMDVLFRARKGEDFGALAQEFSDDKLTAKKGGRMPPVARGQTVPQFEEAAFSLKAGEISDVVETPFGFCIIKRIF